MSISLADALQQVHLEAGHVYQCRIGELHVEVRVEAIPCLLPSSIIESNVVLDPWTDLPSPQSTRVIDVDSGSPVLPDPPIIPADL
jgi:hypothetical protein